MFLCHISSQSQFLSVTYAGLQFCQRSRSVFAGTCELVILELNRNKPLTESYGKKTSLKFKGSSKVRLSDVSREVIPEEGSWIAEGPAACSLLSNSRDRQEP